ncbi:MAG: Rieske 2Fe-2S domain-containing protein [Pseudomonadota bacterium]|nr:Rieske 2Fe-2S domain-containing protein [Pseudomonadota bacterium]
MAEVNTRTMKFGGYHRPRSQEEDLELTHVGPGTPGGEYLRRFWHPIALTSELGELPLAIRILDEELVLFRDGSDQIGLLHLRCSHRNTSLEYGFIQEQGIRCCYHGWHYDVDGTILETPGEPPHSRIKEKLCHGAYPTEQFKGVVFAYMGPPNEMPNFPFFDSFVYPDGNHLVPYKIFNPCNWLQAHENGADPIHTCFLHARGNKRQFSEQYEALPEISFHETPIGLLAVATRRWEEYLWIRASDVILPNAAQFGLAEVASEEKFALCPWLTRWIVPIDNTSAYAIGLRHFNPVIDPRETGNEDGIGLGMVDFPGQVPAADSVEGQRNPGDYEALVAQGPVAIHTNETPGVTDEGVLMGRRQIRAGIRAIAKGGTLSWPARGNGDPVSTYNLELVSRVPARDGEDDSATVRRFGQRVAELIIDSGSLPPGTRQKVARERIEELIAREFS